MLEKDIEQVLRVWESQNKILSPNKKVLISEIIDQISFLFSVGPFYYYILNFESLKMELVNEGTREVLGIAPEDFTMEKVFALMHPEDLSKMHEKEALAFDFALNRISKEDILLYKIVYMFRMIHKDGSYRTILHQVKAISATEDGKILQVLGIHTDISYLNIPFHQKVSFIGINRPSFYNICPKSIFNPSSKVKQTLYSKREIEIIKKLAEGKKFVEIAQQLFVSPHTINTHKKNILRKSGCKNTPELIAKCLMDGVI
ncbi:MULTISPECIES: LuxR C-terminal-related transcriptional regulator [Arenibacter]|uniref:LuxR C-terminal-related transcriptional regulator n=1 Tax=Arenibacter TaxID=178469 RepID=UPI00068BF5F7|nr:MULTISPECIES: LuxR C-terminal-related transcriptional regulator [Arenibacter]GBF20931.1 transcriptional regulatory protein UhpA [Arenibacter sp. NBRC 103722]